MTTSLKKENGERTIGTLLDRVRPSYKALMAGEGFPLTTRKSVQFHWRT